MSERVRVRRVSVGVWWRLLMVTGMVVMLARLLLDVVHAWSLPWRGGYLVLMLGLTPLEAHLSARAADRRGLRGQNRSRFHLAELGSLLALTAVMRLAWQGLPRRWPDGEFVVGSMMVALTWWASRRLVAWLAEIDFHPSEIAPPVTSPDYELHAGSAAHTPQHTAAFRKVLTAVTVGAVLALMLGGMARVDPMAVIDFQRGTIRTLILDVLLYFTFALGLVAEARLALLRTKWQREEADISPAVGRRWPLLVTALLTLAVVASLLLPVGYSVGLLEALSYALNVIIAVMVTIGYLVAYLAGLLLYPFQWLLGTAQETGAPPVPQMEFPPAAQAKGAPVPWLEMIKATAMWLVPLAMAFYALITFGREHRGSWERFRVVSWLQAGIRSLWRWLVTSGESVRQGARATRQAARRRLRGTGRRAAGRPGRQPMDARAWVRHYWLSLMERAEESGLPRRPHLTAEEYGERLARAVPEAEGDVTALTDAFEEARYSQHLVEEETREAARRHWEGAREALERREKGERR